MLANDAVAVNGADVLSAQRLTNSQPRAMKYFYYYYSNAIYIPPCK
jgi:hypothetical protein